MIDYGTVSILMGTYNGEKYIEQQLNSIGEQTYKNWILYISDDGSSDRTKDIILSFAATLPEGKVRLLNGPHQGFAQNFLFMLRDKSINSPWYAFCDQDDIWLSDKLQIALDMLQKSTADYNAYKLYGSRTTLVNNNLEVLGSSPDFTKKFGLQNALVQSFSGGNTMVFNHRLKELFEKLPESARIVSHDWMLYIVCAAVKGNIVFDRKPKILYRQHDRNLVGSNKNFFSKLSRLSKIFNGEYKEWNRLNYIILYCLKDNIAKEYFDIIEYYYGASKGNLFSRVALLQRSGVYRQSAFETMIFIIMNAMGRLV